MRIILYTGKGGVGKTSVSAATGLHAARQGRKTLVLSTDPAHSLSDSFDCPLGPDPVQVAPNLWGQEVDVLREVDRHWGVVSEWLTALMRWQGVDDLLSEEVAILPGMEELVSLLHITGHYDSGAFDALIVDCAPTGETLRLLSLPDVARWYMAKIFPLERWAARALGPIARPVLGNIPVPGTEVFASIEYLFRQVDRMRKILADGDHSSVRMVVNAEKMVLHEAQRAFTYLNLYGYATDLIVCNRLIPEKTPGQLFVKWKESQQRYRQMIGEAFYPIPVLDLPLFDQEVVGLPMLERMGRALFQDVDPTRVWYNGGPQQVIKDGGAYVLALSVPFTEREEVKVLKSGDELVVQAKQHRRSILLPRALAGRPVAGAKLEEGILRVTFGASSPSHRKERVDQR